MLNKVKKGSNMYFWCDYTYNPISGKCPHMCSYCYVEDMAKRFKKPQHPLRLNRKTLKDNLGKNNFIFVSSATDMFADSVDAGWIREVLDYCKIFDNTYLFQTKNPKRLLEFENDFPTKAYLGITLETNRLIPNISKAPAPIDRVKEFSKLKTNRKMISIEPIMDFDPDVFLASIQLIRPEFVSIGADSKNHGLSEPNSNKLNQLIEELRLFTHVKIKTNLHRLFQKS